jgi:hypothetical protein
MATALGVTFCGKLNCCENNDKIKDEKIKTNKERIKELEDDLENKYYNREIIDEKNKNFNLLMRKSSDDIRGIHSDVEKIQNHFKEDIEKIQKELKGDIEKMRLEFKEDIEKIYKKLNDNTVQLLTLNSLIERVLQTSPSSSGTIRKRFLFI